MGGGLSLAPLHLSSEQVQQVASGYARLVTPFHCHANVSSSFSTFLCFGASWMGVNTKYLHCLCRTNDDSVRENATTTFPKF